MDLIEINNLIDEIEDGETSLSNIRNLSALYNVKSHLIGSKNYDSIVKELTDILPSYLQYIEVKRKYQLKETTEENILSYLNRVCTEIQEFIRTLYSSTDTPKEREIIQTSLRRLREIL